MWSVVQITLYAHTHPLEQARKINTKIRKTRETKETTLISLVQHIFIGYIVQRTMCKPKINARNKCLSQWKMRKKNKEREKTHHKAGCDRLLLYFIQSSLQWVVLQQGFMSARVKERRKVRKWQWIYKSHNVRDLNGK